MQDGWRPPAIRVIRVAIRVGRGRMTAGWQLSFIGSGWSWIILVVASDWRFIGGFMVLGWIYERERRV